MNKKEIVVKINSIGKRAETLRDEIQVVLVATVCHVVEYGEASLYDKLIDATKGANRVGIHSWIRDHGGAILKDGKFAVNKTWLKEVRAGYKADPKMARSEFEKRLMESPLPMWYEGAAKKERAEVTKVWDALEKADKLIENIAKQTGGSHLDLERYLREAVEKYKKECI